MNSQRFGARALSFAAGVMVGLMIWLVLLGPRVNLVEPGLWALRFRAVLRCGLDYNGPPYRPDASLWLTCGETGAWRLWPIGR